ncbi:hypothetical protein KI387_005839, partial [Taxus chinensis]
GVASPSGAPVRKIRRVQVFLAKQMKTEFFGELDFTTPACCLDLEGEDAEEDVGLSVVEHPELVFID